MEKMSLVKRTKKHASLKFASVNKKTEAMHLSSIALVVSRNAHVEIIRNKTLSVVTRTTHNVAQKRIKVMITLFADSAATRTTVSQMVAPSGCPRNDQSGKR